jgi:hypothetical protein
MMIRVIAILLLMVAGGEAYACDASDECVPASSGAGSDCDQPTGDNCLCCCHHIVPVPVFALEPGDCLLREPRLEPVLSVLSVSIPIDHPPQL